MKIAIVRGPSLNPWEMQNFLPLARRHELRLIGSIFEPFTIRGVPSGHLGGVLAEGSKIQRLNKVCLGKVFSFFPGGIEFLYHCFGDPQVLLGFEKAISGFDIVHPAELANYYSFQAVRAKQKGLVGKVVVTCWENIAKAREDYPAQRRIKKAVVEGADHFLAVTEGAKKALLAEGVEEEKITVVGMGVKIKRFRDLEIEKFRIKNRRGEKKILFVGRLEEEKGIWELLEAFKDLKIEKFRDLKRFGDLELTIVGKGSQEKKIKSWLSDNKLGKFVHLKGEVGYEKVFREYRWADIFVLPSKPTPVWQEQFGMVLVEAMASGLPIVATKSGAIPEVVGEAGVLVRPGRVEELADAIGRLLKDDRLRKKLVLKGLKRVRERYDCRKVARKIERVYRKVISN